MRLEEEVQNVMKEEVEIPQIVKDRMKVTLEEIKVDTNVKEKKYARKRWHTMKVAAMIGITLLGVGTTAFASVKVFGLEKYLEIWGLKIPEEARELVQEPIVMEEKNESIVDFTVEEALVDKNQMYFEITARAKDMDKYLLISEEDSPKSSIEALHIEGMTEGTIADYAKAQGKELLVVGCSVDTDAPCMVSDYRLEPDGTGVFVISTDNVEKSDIMELICNTWVYPYGKGGGEEMLEDSFAFCVTDKSKEEAYQYKVVENSGAKKAGIEISKIKISQTELTLRVEFIFEKLKKQEEDGVVLQLLDENGEEVAFSGGSAGRTDLLEDGKQKQIRNYAKTELADTLTVKVCDIFTEEDFGTITLERVK